MRDPAPEVAADQRRADGLVGPTGAGEQIRHVDADRHLVDARSPDRAGDRREHRPRSIVRAQLAEPRGAVAGDQPELRERLDVLDERRALAVATVGDERRAQAWQRRPALEVRDDRGLLPRRTRRARNQGEACPVPVGALALADRLGEGREDRRGRRDQDRAAPPRPRRPRLRRGRGGERTRAGGDRLALMGSPSVPLTTTTGREPEATAASLRAVGKPAPPRPRRPARSTSPIRSWPMSGSGAWTSRWCPARSSCARRAPPAVDRSWSLPRGGGVGATDERARGARLRGPALAQWPRRQPDPEADGRDDHRRDRAGADVGAGRSIRDPDADGGDDHRAASEREPRPASPRARRCRSRMRAAARSASRRTRSSARRARCAHRCGRAAGW